MNPKTAAEIEIMREGGKKLATILEDLVSKVEAGVTPKDISAIAAEQIKKAGMQPVVLGYEGFPDVICISVNDGIVHGIPNKREFEDGDIVKLDLTLGYKGLVTDSARTTIVGSKASADARRLVDGTRKSLDAGIAAIKGSGTRVGDIGAAVQKVLEQNKLGVVKEMVGHGVGYGIHEQPNIPNYGSTGTGQTLSAGMTIAIEPMATLGDWRIKITKDGWTALSRDGSLAAHFEHTVLITEDGAEILTSI
jgi:methionyl aminopeptidase